MTTMLSSFGSRAGMLGALALAALTACGGAPQQPPATPAPTEATATAEGHAAGDLIPRDVFFGDPDRVLPQISPDGTRLSYLAPVDGVLNVWVAPIDDLAQARPVTSDRTRPVRRHSWAHTSQHVLYAQDAGGDENWHVFSVDLASGKVTDLTPMPKVAARIEALSARHPDHVLIGMNDRDPAMHDLYKIDIRTGERVLVQQNPGMARFYADDDFRVRLAARMTPDGGTELLAPAAGKQKWKPFLTIPFADSMTTDLIGFGKDGKTAYLQDSRGRNTGALYELDLASKEKRLLAEHAQADSGALILHPTDKTPLAASFDYMRREWKAIDPAFQADLDALARVSEGELELMSATDDGRKWIVAFLGDAQPVRYYLWDRDQQAARFLFVNRPALEGQPLAQMHPLLIQARDGLSLVSYLSLPRDSDPDGDARPDRPLPMVLLVHGGPWGRDGWGYDPEHQLLANRGYAVLSVNFRGSTGFGKQFVNAGNGQWGLAMHDDLIDAVQWAVQAGIADAARVGIMGGSYGGYATLAGLAFTPEVFACGVDIVGPSSIVTLLEAIPPYWQPLVDMFKTRVGDWTTEQGRARLLDRSPLTHANAMVKPLLIAQGANDPRVKQAESEQIVQALTGRAVPITYVLFPDEGHGFARPQNRLAFMAVTEAFLAAHLGGAHQPMTAEDLAKSSIQIPVGATGIPGLPAEQ